MAWRAPRRRWRRSRGPGAARGSASPALARRLFAFSALAAAGIALLVLSGRDDGPLVIDVASPAGLAVADGRVWVTSPRAGTVTPVDASGEVGAPLRVGGAPARIVAGANGLWVTDAAAGRVVPIEVPEPVAPNAAVASPESRSSRRRRGRGRERRRARGRRRVGREHGRPQGLRARAARPLKGIEAGEGPVALAADARRVVAVDAPAGSISIIDARTREFSGQVRSAGRRWTSRSRATRRGWPTSRARARAVDLGSLRVTHTLAIGRRPIALASAGDDLYALRGRSVAGQDHARRGAVAALAPGAADGARGRRSPRLGRRRPAAAVRPLMRRFLLAAALCLVIGLLGGLLTLAVEPSQAPARYRFVPPREAAFDFSLKDQDGRAQSIKAAQGNVSRSRSCSPPATTFAPPRRI